MNTENQPEQTEEQVDPAAAEELGAALADNVEIVLPDEKEQSVDEVTQLRSKVAELEKLALRYQADLENFRKRSRAQMQDQIKYASMPLISELLDSVDNLNRATESAESTGESASLAEGVKMVASQIAGLLQQHGCQPIEAVGQTFDPNLHQAVQMQASEEFDANTVMIEVRPGFKLHDRVIRPAQVFVSTGPAQAESTGE